LPTCAAIPSSVPSITILDRPIHRHPAAESASSRAWTVHAPSVCAFAFAAFVLLAGLGTLPLIVPDEGRNAEIAREMAASGNWLVPTYDGIPYLDKPAFFFKAVALAFTAFGESEGAARLPSVLFGLATLALVWLFARRAFGLRAAALSVVALVTMPIFVVYARLVIFDVPLTFFVIAAIFAGYIAEEHEGWARRRWYLASAAAVGLATLVKGPVGFIVPFVVLAAFHLVERRPAAIARIVAPMNLALFFALVLPWFFGLAHERPDFPRYGLVEETFHRFTSDQFNRSEPIWFFGWVIAGGALAWTFAMPEAIVATWKARARLARPERLLVTWVIAVVVFFSLSQSKRAGYVLPGMIAIALLLGRLADLAFAEPRGRAARILGRAVLALGAIALVGAVLAGIEAVQPGFSVEHFGARPEKVAWFRACFAPLCAAFACVAALAFASRARHSPKLAIAAMAGFPVLIGAAAFSGFEALAAASSPTELARSIEARAPGVDVACLRKWPDGLDFYLKRELVVISRDGGELKSRYIPYTIARAVGWPPELVHVEDAAAWLDDRTQRVFVITDEDRREALTTLVGPRGAHVETLAPDWIGALVEPSSQSGTSARSR
jgi:4-amino-4-deoxy-L-arabinose transferase-like glycosyltransferase